jgi:hypothetical protein
MPDKPEFGDADVMIWLANPVTPDGEGYKLLLKSPAGSEAVISNDLRRRIIACVNFCRFLSTEQMQDCAEAECPFCREIVHALPVTEERWSCPHCQATIKPDKLANW